MRGFVIRLLIKKDIKDLRKNISLLPVMVMAPFLSFLYSRLEGIPTAEMLPYWVLYGLAMVGIMLPAFGVAEEKEKGTLDSLLVSPATNLEIVAGKVFFTLMMITVITLLTLAPNGGLRGNQLWLWLGVFLSATFFIQVGLIIGLFAKNQVSAGAYMTPSMLFFILSPLFISIMPGILKMFFQQLPSLAMLEIGGGALNGLGMQTFWPKFVTLIVWNGIAYIFTMLGFRHQFR